VFYWLVACNFNGVQMITVTSAPHICKESQMSAVYSEGSA
jgi:hypothetical protein